MINLKVLKHSGTSLIHPLRANLRGKQKPDMPQVACAKVCVRVAHQLHRIREPDLLIFPPLNMQPCLKSLSSSVIDRKVSAWCGKNIHLLFLVRAK